MSIIVKSKVEKRSDRISAFVDEVRRYVYNECFNQGISVNTVDCFCYDMFICMNRNEAEYGFFDLLHMLTNSVFMVEVFARYKNRVA